MKKEILVRAFEEDKKVINSVKGCKKQQERLHEVVRVFREATGS